jgi:hypothetical protein
VNQKRTQKVKKVFALVVVVVILVGGIACATKVTVPEGYEQVSPVIPGHGGHWANLAEFGAQVQAQEPIGPIYIIDGKGEVVAIEYMYSEDMLQEVSIPTPEGAEVFEALTPLPVGVTVDHVEIAFFLEGHPEIFEVPHWDIHFFFITQEEKAAITPEG